MKYNIIATVLLFSFIHAVASGQTKIYVSPTGNDSNPGTINRPLANLNVATELARKIKTEGGKTVIYLRGGNYFTGISAKLYTRQSSI